MTTPAVVDVLVVGAGPTGCTTAIELARRGHSVRIVDSAATGFGGSRAKGIQPRTLEVFHDLGVVDEILAAGTEYPLMGFHLGPVTIPWRMTPSRGATDSVPYPNTLLIPQRSTDAILRNRLRAMGVQVEPSSELLDLEQHDDYVTATVGQTRIDARYVVGADGGSSRVRKSQSIGFSGTTDDADRIIIVDAVTTGLSRNRWHVWPGLRGRFTGACPLPHSEQFQWMIRLNPNDSADIDDERLIRSIRGRTRSSNIEIGDIAWKSVFRPNIRLADRYRDRRVFLAGDAAHVHTPAGAQGLNTGIQDAYNLGWKLSAVLSGAPDALLDTYEAERRPIAAAVLGLSSEKYAGIGKLDPSALKRGDDEQQLTLTYRTSGGDDSLHVGDRAPDATLISRDHGRRRLFDILHSGRFTVLSHGPAAAQQLRHLRGGPATLGAVDPGDTTGDFEALFDGAGAFASTYGPSAGSLVLIRPDGYIAALTDDPAEVDSALRQMTGMKGSETNA